MKKSLFFKQTKPLTVQILGSILLFFSLYLWIFNSGTIDQKILLGVLSILLITYSVSFEIGEHFQNYKHINFFGFSVIKTKLNIKYPDYMVVFSAKYKQNAEWGSVAAMGKMRKGDSYVIRFFTGNKFFTLYRTPSLSKAKEKALVLSKFLNVEIITKA